MNIDHAVRSDADVDSEGGVVENMWHGTAPVPGNAALQMDTVQQLPESIARKGEHGPAVRRALFQLESLRGAVLGFQELWSELDGLARRHGDFGAHVVQAIDLVPPFTHLLTVSPPFSLMLEWRSTCY